MSAREWPGVRNEPVAVEAALIQAASNGDRSAAERLLAPHERPLYRLCRGMLGQAEDAEDAVQETFLRALRALPRFRGDAALRTWLHRIAVNVCLEWKRARPPLDLLPTGVSEGPAPELAGSPEEIVLRQLRALDALGTLPRRQRALLLLREVEGWSIGEIAAALSCSKKRVENDLYRARCAVADWRRREAETGEQE